MTFDHYRYYFLKETRDYFNLKWNQQEVEEIEILTIEIKTN